MAKRSVTRAAGRQSSSSSHRTRRSASRKSTNGDFWSRAGAEGSIAQMVSESPGGFEGALGRLQAAKAAGKEPSVAIALGEQNKDRSVEDEVYSAASNLLQAISLLEVITRSVAPDAELETSLQMTIRHLHEAHDRFDRIAQGGAGGAP